MHSHGPLQFLKSTHSSRLISVQWRKVFWRHFSLDLVLVSDASSAVLSTNDLELPSCVTLLQALQQQV